MPNDPVPCIKPEDYDGIRALAPDLPRKYADWKAVYEGNVAERRRKGHEPRPIQISFSVFAEYLASHGRKGSIHELLRCALGIAGDSTPNVRGD